MTVYGVCLTSPSQQNRLQLKRERTANIVRQQAPHQPMKSHPAAKKLKAVNDFEPSDNDSFVASVTAIPSTEQCTESCAVFCSTSTQTDRRHRTEHLRTVGSQSALVFTTDQACSPVVPVVSSLSLKNVDGRISDICITEKDSDSDYNDLQESQCSQSTVPTSQNSDVHNLLLNCRAIARQMARCHSNRYLGLSEQFLFVVEKLAEKLPCTGNYYSLTTTDIVEIVLRKLRLNESFDILSDSYGISKSQISRVFSRYLPVLSTYMNDLIMWPTLSEVRRRLPLAFKTRYRNVISIIDCLEIEIQKPSKAVEQSLTWSDYKHANTVKYLVSCTPDGTINYVSAGYSGRISDVQLVTECGYLNHLQPGETVMADRGFKSIETLLHQKGCCLCKPPSVSKNDKLSKQLVHEAKVIAALRVHVERVIRRIREYHYLAPHACIPSHLVSLTDCAIIVVAGLVNLQGPLIVA
jgi:hypothetical protein